MTTILYFVPMPMNTMQDRVTEHEDKKREEGVQKKET